MHPFRDLTHVLRRPVEVTAISGHPLVDFGPGLVDRVN